MDTSDYNSFAAQFIYPVYKGFFGMQSFLLSPLHFSHHCISSSLGLYFLISTAFQWTDQSGILSDTVPESLKMHYTRNPWEKINAVIGNNTL